VAKAVEMIPTLVTLGNLFSGFLAIAYLTDSLHTPNDPERIELLYRAIVLIFVAMFFDAVDGWVARKLGHSSDFGAQVDSICDAISFGAAPALLFKVMCEAQPNGLGPKRALVLAVMFLAFAVLRLARFNLDSDADEESHQTFEGLPTPAAAAVVASLGLANLSLEPTTGDSWVRHIMPYVMPLLAFLMVSRVPYVHAASWLLRRKSFPALVALLFLIGIVVIAHQVMIPVLAIGFMAWGPVVWFWRRVRGRQEPII
jgi:CDP-diacylglycerol--serine O-phosphatidyltransferase